MSELKKKTVRELRELARRHVGAGHSKLKTKKELVAALERALAKNPGVRKSGQSRQPVPARLQKPASWRKPAPVAVKPARDAVKPAPDIVKPAADAVKPAPDAMVTDGFFLKRGNAVPWAHPERVPPALPGPQAERLARQEPNPLPRQYPQDRMVLLARDPTTLFLFWDFRLDGQTAARGGTASSRWMMRLFDEGGVVREIEFNPRRGSLYFYNLKPGRHYRAEAYVLGSDGKARRWAKATRSVELPSEKPLVQGPVRMLRFSWQSPVAPKVEQQHRAEIQTLPPYVSATIRRQFSVQSLRAAPSSPQNAWGPLRSGLAP